MTVKDVILTVTLMLGAGLCARLVADVLHLPHMLVLLGVGILLGPSVSDSIDVPLDSMGAQLVLTLGVSFILFHGGLQLSLGILRKVAVGLLLLVVPGVVLTALVTGSVAALLFGLPLSSGLLIGAALSPTDPAILAMVQVPADTSGATARERFSKHSAQLICAGCHQFLDPIGFALENFDPIGQYRTQENNVTIDATSTVPGLGPVSGPVDLVQKIAGAEEAQNSFASHWTDFGYGRTLGTDDQCTQMAVNASFKKSGYNVKQLLLALTQTDAFLYRAAQ
jgi:hypothetical protein